MSWITTIFADETLRTLFIIVFVVALIMLVVLFIQYNLDRRTGRHAKFLWFESKPAPETAQPAASGEAKYENSKNINEGTNVGRIGDEYTGIEQRTVTNGEIERLVRDIKAFQQRYATKIKEDYITLGYPGDKESTLLTEQIAAGLHANGYTDIRSVTLVTYGVIGKKFSVSNAPDDSVMVEIFPADNV
jgi:hypothetical protein